MTLDEIATEFNKAATFYQKKDFRTAEKRFREILVFINKRKTEIGEADLSNTLAISSLIFADICDIQMRLPPKEKEAEEPEMRPLDLE